MKDLKLNPNLGKTVIMHGYQLNPTEQYCICPADEKERQKTIKAAIKTMGGLLALNDYHNWLKASGFDVSSPNPTNDFVAPFFGVKPLWHTDLSQGIVVKNKDDNNYYIVIECSWLNKGFRNVQLILTMGGCV